MLVIDEPLLTHLVQERMTSEKNRLVDLLSTCNQVDREALEAKLEHDQKLALRDQYQAFLDTQERSMTGTVEAVEEPPAFGSLLESDHTVEGLLALLRDRLNKQFYTSISVSFNFQVLNEIAFLSDSLSGTWPLQKKW